MRLFSHSDSSGAATDVAVSWTGVAALLLTLLFYVAVAHPLGHTSFGELFVARGRVPYAIAFFASWSAVILMAKLWALRREREAFTLDLLPTRLGHEITPENAADFVAHLDALPGHASESVVAERLRRALSHFAIRRDPREVVEQIGARAQADADAVESSYTLLRVFIWAVPILGFIGTVIGIGAAVGGFSTAIGAAADLAVMKGAIGSVTTGLSVAFDTTLLALVMSIVIMFPASALQKSEEDFLAALEDYSDRHLLKRLSAPESAPAREHDVIERAIASAMASHHAELRGWLDRLGSIGDSLTQQVSDGWLKVDEQLRVRQESQLERLSEWGASSQRETSEELAETQRHLLGEFRGHLEGMAAEVRRVQEASAARLDDQLAAVERLHRRVQDAQTNAAETQRVQAQEFAAAAENLARTLGRVRSEAGEVRDEGARVLGEFAGQLRDAAREAQSFQRELMAAGESQAGQVARAGERLSATLARIDDQVRAWAQADLERAELQGADRESEDEHRRVQRDVLLDASRELATTLDALRATAGDARHDLAQVSERLDVAARAISQRASGEPRLSRFFRRN